MWDQQLNQLKTYASAKTESFYGLVSRFRTISFFKHYIFIILILSIAILAAHFLPLESESEHWFTICWWKVLTGWDCPGCGLGRAVICFFRGDFSLSWQYHPFGIPVSILGISGLVLRQNIGNKEWDKFMRNEKVSFLVFIFSVSLFVWFFQKHFF